MLRVGEGSQASAEVWVGGVSELLSGEPLWAALSPGAAVSEREEREEEQQAEAFSGGAISKRGKKPPATTKGLRSLIDVSGENP